MKIVLDAMGGNHAHGATVAGAVRAARELVEETQVDQVTQIRPGEEQRLPMSYQEFLAWSDEDLHAEWVRNEVIVFMPPTILHQHIVGFLNYLLTWYARSRNLGVVLLAPFEMRAIPNGSAREPDLAFIANEHVDRLTPERLVGPADLVVEVVSDSSVTRDRVDKFYEYQDVGVREYWIIDPRAGKERVDVYWLTPQGRYQATLPDAQGRYYATVLPGFWFRAEWLFGELPLDPLQAINEINEGDTSS